MDYMGYAHSGGTTRTSPIMHLIYPPKFCITFVFISRGSSTEKLKTMLMQSFGGGRGEGANKVDYGRCASGVWLNSMASRDFFFFC